MSVFFSRAGNEQLLATGRDSPPSTGFPPKLFWERAGQYIPGVSNEEDKRGGKFFDKMGEAGEYS